MTAHIKHIEGQFSAQMVEASINVQNGIKLATMSLVYPRFIHAEFMTHRVFSRNAASSRAIPVAKMIEQVRTNPAMPVHWGKNQPGMKAREVCTEPINVPIQLTVAFDIWLAEMSLPEQDGAERYTTAQEWWVFLAWVQSLGAEAFMGAGYHKQVANRPLEPFQLMQVVVSATDWDNFFELRDHADAQPEIQVLARLMKKATGEAQWVERGHVKGTGNYSNQNNWHLPYVSQEERESGLYDIGQLCSMSAARCARVSYLNHDGSTPSPEKDFKLFSDLVGSKPLHASPTEHQAFAMLDSGHMKNFRGWRQFRFDVEELMSRPAHAPAEDEGSLPD